MKRRRAPAQGRPMRLTIVLDRGIASYLRAYCKTASVWGNERQTAVAMIREGLLDVTKNQHLLGMMLPHLPPSIQEAWRHSFVPRNEAQR